MLKLSISASNQGYTLIGMVPPPHRSKPDLQGFWLKQAVSASHNPSTYLFLFNFFLFLWVQIPWMIYFLFPLFRAKPPMQTSLLECSCLILHSKLKTQLSPVHVMLTYDWNIQTWTPGIFHLLFICWADARRATAARNPAGQVLPVGVIEKQ